jgi:hypothetical protein
MRRGSSRRRVVSSAECRLAVAIAVTAPPATVAIVAIVVTVGARMIIDRRGAPSSPVWIVARRALVVEIVAVTVILTPSHVVLYAPRLP